MDENEAQEFLTMGKDWLKKHSLPAAVNAFRMSLNRNPQSAECNHYLGLTYMEMEEYGEAVFAFRTALELEKSERNYRSLADAYSEVGDLLAAQAVLETALNDFPESADINFNLGYNYKQQGSSGLAEQQYLVAVRYNSQHFQALTNLGCLWMKRQNYQRALAYFEQALEVEPHAKGLLENVAIACFYLQNMERRAEVLALLLMHHPDSDHLRSCNVLDWSDPDNWTNVLEF